jgi:hypothetical protein
MTTEVTWLDYQLDASDFPSGMFKGQVIVDVDAKVYMRSEPYCAEVTSISYRGHELMGAINEKSLKELDARMLALYLASALRGREGA